MLQFAKEGYPFILFFFALTLLSLFLRLRYLSPAFLILTLFMLYFFRDPERTASTGEGGFIAPADGRIVQIRETIEDELSNEKMMEVSIFMNAFNVHVNRAPCDGVVKEVKYYPGRFMAAWSEEASKANEHITMLLDTEHGGIVVRQVAGLLARRAVCRVKPGERLSRGERFGIIKFSSRVDIFLPLNTEIKVKLNDRVKAGETIIAVRNQRSAVN
ncbi:MAG: phosphatidylserine decarboxylase family protein [Nitrospirae bacterium]|nr:phosphatidylserine decarboxylase family protein [Nitrospirota bacterium]